MKVEIDKSGNMYITAETWKDDAILKEWYQENKRRECMDCIVFNTKGTIS